MIYINLFCGGDFFNMQSSSLEDDEPSHFAKIFGLKNSYKNSYGIASDLLNHIKKAKANGVILPFQEKIMENILNLGKVTVYDIMTHRIDIKAVEKKTRVKDVLKVFAKLKFSKIPVYEDDVDSIVGVCHLKDLFFLSLENSLNDQAISCYMKKPIFVPESMKCEKLLLQMQNEQKDLAIVVDEYGGTSGIVSLKDVLDVVFRTNSDTNNLGCKDFTKIDDYTVILPGDANLKNVSEILNIPIEKSSNFDTLGGFLVVVLGRIPDKNEQPVVNYNGVEFKILSVNKQHIEKVRAVKMKKIVQ